MKKEIALMAATATLFVGASVAALLVWHSWYLYGGAVLTGYVVLSILAVILKRKTNIEFHHFEQFIHDKTVFYSSVSICYGITLLFNIFLVAGMQDSIGIRVLMICLDFITASAAFITVMYWCERRDWRIWLNKVLFG